MSKITKIFLGLSSASLLFMAACSNTTTTSTTNTPSSSTEVATKDHSQPQAGGQVVETGKYHLEFVSIPEPNGFHLDFFVLSGDSHQLVENAKVTSQIILPSGERKSLDFTYDAPGKHYAGYLNESAPGDYQIIMQTDIQGEKVNSRFAFKK